MNRRKFLGGVGVAASVAWAGGCANPSGAGSRELRVLTYNLHHGEGVDGRLDLERIAGVIRAAQPDLVALQEVDRRAARTGSVDQPVEYARMLGMEGQFGSAMPFQGGDYGQMLLSRWPMEGFRVVRLPGTPGREPRIAVTAAIEVPGFGKVQWTGCHLDASRTDEDRWEQAGALLREFGATPHPALLAGDFNATPESRVMLRLLETSTGWVDTAGGGAAPTIPAEAPRSRIDFVLARPRTAWRVASSEVLPESVASDHRPLRVVLHRA